MFVFFVLVLYIFANVANIVYHRGWCAMSSTCWPNWSSRSLGIGIDAYILYKGFFASESRTAVQDRQQHRLVLPGLGGLGVIWTPGGKPAQALSVYRRRR